MVEGSLVLRNQYSTRPRVIVSQYHIAIAVFHPRAVVLYRILLPRCHYLFLIPPLPSPSPSLPSPSPSLPSPSLHLSLHQVTDVSMFQTVYLTGGTDGTENFADLWLLRGCHSQVHMRTHTHHTHDTHHTHSHSPYTHTTHHTHSNTVLSYLRPSRPLTHPYR